MYGSGSNSSTVNTPGFFQSPFITRDAYHGRNARGVGYCLGTYFLVAFLVVAYIIYIYVAWLAVLYACEDTADVGLAYGARTEGCRVGKECAEELDRNYLLSVVVYWLCAEHAYVLETSHVGEVALSEGHEETDAPDARNVLCEGLYLFVVEQVHVLLAHAVEVICAVDFHRTGLYPVSVFPVGTVCAHFAQVDLGLKLVANGYPWSPPLQSRMSMVWISSK